MQHHKNAKEQNFAVRDKVWNDSKKHTVGLSPKLCNRWDGPYYRNEDRGNQTYTCMLRRCSDNAPVNANRLKRFYDPQDRPTNNEANDSDDDDNEEQEPVAQPKDNIHTDNNDDTHQQNNDDNTNSDNDICNDEYLYMVEKIIKTKIDNGKIKYFIKWEGYSSRKKYTTRVTTRIPYTHCTTIANKATTKITKKQSSKINYLRKGYIIFFYFNYNA